MEGDGANMTVHRDFDKFLSTPSGWRATPCNMVESQSLNISIHALRVEGDDNTDDVLSALEISIHALRVEGDSLRAYLP